MKPIIKEFAILDEHDLVDDQGKTVLSLDTKKLYQITENNNRRIKETGDKTPIVIGHTKDGVKEEQQPQIVGWARSFKVKKLLNADRNAIWVTAEFDPQFKAKLSSYPRRSVELWLRKMMIDPIALLGATTPERDLGVLKFSSDGEKKYQVGSPEDEKGTDDNDKSPDKTKTKSPEKKMGDNSNLVQEVLAALQETDVWKFMEQKMQAEQDDGQEPGADDQSMPLDDGDVPMDPGPDGQQQYGGSPSPASGSNSFPPKTQMAGSGQMVRLQAKVGSLEKRLMLAKRENDLIRLEAEGFAFDLQEELSTVEDMDDPKYSAYLTKIRHRFHKAPVGNRVFTTPISQRPSTSASMTKEQSQKVAGYAIAHNLSFEAAKSALEDAPY